MRGRRETLALALGTFVSLAAALGLALLAPAAGAGPAQQTCPVPTTLLQPCPEQTGSTTSSTEVTTTTIPEETTTTTETATTSTARPSTTAAAPTTEAPPETLNNLLVPGPIDSATGQPVTTTTAAPVAVEADADNAGTIVALVISGLLVVALLIAILTWRYWRVTRPKAVAQRAMNARTLR